MIINLKSPTELSGFYVVYEGSTLLEGPGLRGASHLLEHLMAKTFDHMQDELQTHCVTWNAYTSVNEVVFWLQGLESELNLFRRKLLTCLSEFPITEEQFQNEKNIVLQEYKDVFSDPYWTHMHNVERSRFGYYSPIGHRDDLEALTLDKLRAYWEMWFTKPTKIISVSDRYQHFESRPMARVAVLDRVLRPDHKQAIMLEANPQVQDNSVVLIQTNPISQDVPALKVAGRCLSGGLNSPLYQEIREKRGLCYGVWLTSERYNEEYLFNLSANVSDANAHQMATIAMEVLNDPKKYVTPERLEMVRKEFILEERIDAINRYKDVAPWLIPEKFQVRTVINDITLEQVHDVIGRYLNSCQMNLFVDKKGYG